MLDHLRNLAELHQQQAWRLGPRPAVRHKRHGLLHDYSHAAYHADALACAAALVEAGIGPGDRVGVLSENRLEWLIADMGLLAAAAVNVPPHAPLTAPQIYYQLEDSQARWLFISTRRQLDKVQEIVANLPELRGIVVFDRLPALALRVGGPVTFSWDAFLAHGRQALERVHTELAHRVARLGRDDLATIMYTSGTTGNPKGVMLTHGNLLSNVEQVLAAEPPGPDDVQLNWLPFSHIYARTMDHYRTLAAGTVLALAESVDTLIDDLDLVWPTHMNSVPRFYEKVLTAEASSDPAETARGLRKVFGPRIDFLCSGGAPLPLSVAEAYRAAGILLIQGYGLTESAPVITFNRKARHRLHTVGLPLPGVEVKIGADGEVLTRGPHVMPGYWNNPAATAEAIRDGWLHTGDIGKLDDDGFLAITGRKKELLVLSNGKKVVPNHIEGLLLADPCIDQAVVCGEGKNFLTALIVPHFENLSKEFRPWTANEEACRAIEVYDFYQRRIHALLKDVSSWEQVKKFVLLPRAFSVAGDELTVSLKLRRNVIVAKYRAELERLYGE